MSSTLKKSRRAILSIFFINGTLFSSWIPHIPLIQERLEVGEGLLGLALLGMAMGAIVSMPLSGLLCNKYGSGRITAISALAFAFSLPLPILAPHFLSFCLTLFCFGAFNGAMDVAMNAQAITVEKQHQRPIMSAFHGWYSLGGLTGSALGGVALAQGVNPTIHVTAISSCVLVAIAITIRFFVASTEEETTEKARFPLPTRPILGLGALAFFVLVAEGSVADWSAVYIKNTLQTGPGMAAAGYAAFSLTMALGRLTGDRFVAALGPVALARITSLIAALGLGAALLLAHPVAAILGFACVGLGLSNLIPVLFSAAGRIPGVPSGTGIAAVASAGYAGFLAGPPVIGFIAELSSLSIALGAVVVSILIVAIYAHLANHHGADQCTGGEKILS